MRNFSPRKLICLMIPIFGTVSIVGTGFSLWVFNPPGTPITQQASLNVDVTSVTKIGAFDENSLKTEGTVNDAEQHQIFPSMVVFEEGHGLENDLTKGINFYKKTLNHPDKPGYDEKLPIFIGQPYFGDRVDIIFYLDDLLRDDTKFKLEASILVTSELSKAIAVLDKFQFSNQTVVTQVPSESDPSKMNTLFTYEFTKLCSIYKSKIKGSDIKSKVIQKENIFDNNMYWKYTYNFNLGEVFRYVSMDFKPTTVAAYKRIVKIIQNTDEKLQFTFKASVMD